MCQARCENSSGLAPASRTYEAQYAARVRRGGKRGGEGGEGGREGGGEEEGERERERANDDGKRNNWQTAIVLGAIGSDGPAMRVMEIRDAKHLSHDPLLLLCRRQGQGSERSSGCDQCR